MLKDDASIAARSAHTRQVKQWTRELLSDGDAATVMVGELECAEPGCPPRETVIALLREDGRSEQHKVHRPLLEVTRDDVRRVLSRDGCADACGDRAGVGPCGED